MASAKQIAANRANAQKSTGPTSVEGKKKSSQNALRHGLTGQTTVMTDDDRIQHDAFCKDMLAGLAPLGPVETFLAASISEDAWRMNCARSIETNMFSIGHFDGTGDRFSAGHHEIHAAVTAAWVFRDHAHAFELLTLYEQRIHRTFQKNFEHLRKLQAERKTQREADLDKARLLSQLNQLKDLPYDPAADGLVFANDEIDRAIDIYHRYRQAREEDYTYLKHTEYFKLPKAA